MLTEGEVVWFHRVKEVIKEMQKRPGVSLRYNLHMGLTSICVSIDDALKASDSQPTQESSPSLSGGENSKDPRRMQYGISECDRRVKEYDQGTAGK